MLSFLLNQISGDLYILWKHKDNNFYFFINEIKSTIPKDAKILGAMDLWLGLYDYEYITLRSPEHIENSKPEFVILNDVNTWGLSSSTVGRRQQRGKYMNYILIYLTELCEEKGILLRKIEDKFYGSVEIFRIVW